MRGCCHARSLNHAPQTFAATFASESSIPLYPVVYSARSLIHAPQTFATTTVLILFNAPESCSLPLPAVIFNVGDARLFLCRKSL